MASFKIRMNDHVLTVERDMIPVQSISEPDPNWRYTDAAGHDHFAAIERRAGDGGDPRVTGYPTLEWITEPHECGVFCEENGCPGQRHVCRQCGEEIRTGSRMGTLRHLAGLVSYEIDGEPVTPEQARAFVTQWQTEINQRFGHDPVHPHIMRAGQIARQINPEGGSDA